MSGSRGGQRTCFQRGASLVYFPNFILHSSSLSSVGMLRYLCISWSPLSSFLRRDPFQFYFNVFPSNTVNETVPDQLFIACVFFYYYLHLLFHNRLIPHSVSAGYSGRFSKIIHFIGQDFGCFHFYLHVYLYIQMLKGF